MRHTLFITLAIASAAMFSAPPLAPAQAPAGEELLVPLARSSPVDEYAGWLLFSRWDGERYRLSSWHDGELRDLPVPAQAQTFDADLGPDSRGRPSVVVSLCAGSCDLFVIGLRVGDRLRPVRNANTNGHDEIAPTVWKGRLAFGRRYGADKVIPYTKLLSWPRARRSERLAGLPTRRCGAVDPPACRRIEETRLPAMDLWGRWVAQSWTYQPDSFPGFRQNEIRLTNVSRSDTRQVAYMATGLGGQTYLGPSIAEGRVAFFRACQGDPGGCSTTNSGAIRYRISNGRYEIDGAVAAWSGWAWSGATAYRVTRDDTCAGGDPGIPAEACGIYRRQGLDWRPIDAERVR
ncbi:MAG TPA: hypothetical protein VGR11_16120 [Solirubrobacteraceae bacterium]|nr:hypothetical protein [Solirubrobacteraceae bacterium]